MGLGNCLEESGLHDATPDKRTRWIYNDTYVNNIRWIHTESSSTAVTIARGAKTMTTLGKLIPGKTKQTHERTIFIITE